MACNTCGSKHRHLHPAMQSGGEVEVCRDDFHRVVTPQNTLERILGAGLTPIGSAPMSSSKFNLGVLR